MNESDSPRGGDASPPSYVPKWAPVRSVDRGIDLASITSSRYLLALIWPTSWRISGSSASAATDAKPPQKTPPGVSDEGSGGG